MVRVERTTGGTKVVVCPSCDKPVLESDDAVLIDGTVVHDHCDIDPEDPSTLVFWAGGDG